jgi:hypothetical protein
MFLHRKKWGYFTQKKIEVTRARKSEGKRKTKKWKSDICYCQMGEVKSTLWRCLTYSLIVWQRSHKSDLSYYFKLLSNFTIHAINKIMYHWWWKCQGKGTVHPATGHEGPNGSRGIALIFP